MAMTAGQFAVVMLIGVVIGVTVTILYYNGAINQLGEKYCFAQGLSFSNWHSTDNQTILFSCIGPANLTLGCMQPNGLLDDIATYTGGSK